MKSFLLLLAFFAIARLNVNGQPCTVSYSYAGNDDTIIFTNLASILNAHYYWSFGDGTGSNDISPSHIFPESGKYFVILYGKDTISGCRNFFETWVTVVKQSTEICQPFITDTVVNTSGEDYWIMYDSSSNCGGYYSYIDGGTAGGFQSGWAIWLPQISWGRRLFVGRIQFYSTDSINPFILHRAYYKTKPYQWNSGINYDSCSANFEVIVEYQSNNAIAHFTAMNETALNYTYIVGGFGSPIYYYNSTVAHLCAYDQHQKYAMYLATLCTEDSNGCRDTVTQQFIIQNPYYVTGISESILRKDNFLLYPNPTSAIFNFEFELTKNSPIEIQIYNILGEVIYEEKKGNESGTVKKKIDLSHFAAGIYFLLVQTKEGTATAKIVKQ